MTAVLDASALLAFLLDEPGQEHVDAMLTESIMSSVNWSEVIQQLVRRGADTSGCRQDLEALGLSIIQFDVEMAEKAALLWATGRPYGLSLGDRACLALGMIRQVPILTADRIWATAFPELEIHLIR